MEDIFDDDSYTQPFEDFSSSNHDSGVSTLGRVNHSYLSAPESEMESSFSDEQKLCSSKVYLKSKTMRDSEPAALHKTAETTELSLPPPPGNNMWLPVGQSHSADGVIGSYPPWMNSYPYVHPSMLKQQTFHPSLQSLASTASLSAEEQQILFKFRQNKLKTSGTRESMSPDGEAGHLYEELPGYQYNTHHQIRLRQSLLEGKAPPHLPPISSLPSGSQASGLDTLDDESFTEHEQPGHNRQNPLYEASDKTTAPAIKNEGIPSQAENKLYLDQSELNFFSRRQCRCFCVTLLIMSVVATAALVITLATSMGVLNLAGEVPTQAPDPQYGAVIGSNYSSTSTAQMEQLQQDVAMLMSQSETQSDLVNELNAKMLLIEQENAAMKVQLNKTTHTLDLLMKNSTEEMLVLSTSLQETQDDVILLSHDIANVNNSLGAAIDEVSKMPGPQGEPGEQGPDGFLDPTLCTHKAAQFTSSSGPFEHTVSSGSVTETNQTKVIAASCSSESFQSVLLAVTESNGKNTYECKCTKALVAEIACRMDYWSCAVPTQ